MFGLINLVGLILAALALFERRAWPFLCLLLAVWWTTMLSEGHEDRLQGLSYRVGIDIIAGILCFLLIHRDRFGTGVFAVFVLMCLNHAMFWLSYANELNLWSYYSWGINALWLVQMGLLALPGGRVICRVCADYGRSFSRGRVDADADSSLVASGSPRARTRARAR